MNGEEIQALYLGCHNMLYMDGDISNYEFYSKRDKQSTHQIIGQDNDKNLLVIEPKSITVPLYVFRSTGEFVAEMEFQVRRVPKPTLAVRTNGQVLIDTKQNHLSREDTIFIQLSVEEYFSSVAPADTTYQPGKMRFSFWHSDLSIKVEPISTGKGLWKIPIKEYINQRDTTEVSLIIYDLERVDRDGKASGICGGMSFHMFIAP